MVFTAVLVDGAETVEDDVLSLIQPGHLTSGRWAPTPDPAWG